MATKWVKVGADDSTETKMCIGARDFARGYRPLHHWTSSVREAETAKHSEAPIAKRRNARCARQVNDRKG
jgi:hypothetical protein